MLTNCQTRVKLGWQEADIKVKEDLDVEKYRTDKWMTWFLGRLLHIQKVVLELSHLLRTYANGKDITSEMLSGLRPQLHFF
jgi:hypothetical protein